MLKLARRGFGANRVRAAVRDPGAGGTSIGSSGLDALALLRLQIEWGADEALELEPVDRLRPPAAPRPASTVVPAPPPPPRPPVGTSPPAAGTAPPPAERGQAAAARAAAAAAHSLPALREAIAAFDGCSLRDTATHLVFAQGDPASGVMIVGEVPDAEEDRAGHPFAGQSGLLLDRMLESIGLDRQHLLLTPLIPWRPPGDSKPSEFHLSACLPFLERLLVLAQPRHVLLMGTRPAKLLANAQIRAHAGWQRLTVPGLDPDARALAMRHPAYLLSHLPARRDAWIDLLRLRTALDGAETPRDRITDA